MSNDDTKDMVETVDVSPRDPDLPQVPGGDVFRQLLHQAVRVADMANSQAMRMALDFAKVYEREQGVRAQFENQLKQMTLMEKQATRYAEDLAGMLRSERERRQELERALEQERIASEELRRTGLQGISHLLLAATIKDRTTGTHLQRVRRYVEAIAERLGLQSALVEEFGYSSVMHDVGKIHTPDHILQSEHHLSDAEFSVIKQHCIDGEKMLRDRARDRARAPRALGRQRLPRREEGRGDLARRTDRLDRRRVRRAHFEASIQRGVVGRSWTQSHRSRSGGAL